MKYITVKELLGDIEKLLDLPASRVELAPNLLRDLHVALDEIVSATDPSPEKEEFQLHVNHAKKVGGKLLQSLLNLRNDERLREDWERLAQRDLLDLKDGLMALREFVIDHEEFIKKACIRAGIKIQNIDLEKLVNELHEEGAISEHAWAIFMSQPLGSSKWRKFIRKKEARVHLSNISRWFLYLKEVKNDARQG